MKTGNTSVLVLLEQLVHSFLKQWKNRSEEEEVLHQRWGKSIRKRNNNTTNSQTLLLFTHKVLLDINTNIFLPTSMKNTAGVPTVRAAGAFHLITWAGEFHVRQEVTSVFLLLCWRAARCPESAERFLVLIVFFPFMLICLAPKKNAPREVPPAVKQEVGSFKLLPLLPPAREKRRVDGRRGSVGKRLFLLRVSVSVEFLSEVQ